VEEGYRANSIHDTTARKGSRNRGKSNGRRLPEWRRRFGNTALWLADGRADSSSLPKCAVGQFRLDFGEIDERFFGFQSTRFFSCLSSKHDGDDGQGMETSKEAI
jgi:hypothetical protein